MHYINMLCFLYICLCEQPTLGVKKPRKALLFVILSPVGSYFSTGAKPVSLWADSKYIRAWRGGTGDCKMGGWVNEWERFKYFTTKPWMNEEHCCKLIATFLALIQMCASLVLYQSLSKIFGFVSANLCNLA